MNNTCALNNSSTCKGTSYLDIFGVPLIVSIITINGLLTITATLFNAVIILTFIKTRSLRSVPSNILILSLALTDFGVGALVHPSNCVRFYAILNDDAVLLDITSKVFNISALLLIYASLLTITATTIDRFLAVYLHLRYSEIVTTKRTMMTIICIWLFSIVWTIAYKTVFSYVIVRTISRILDYSFLFLNIALMLKISCVVRKHAAQINAQAIQDQQGEIPQMKKSVNIMYCIVVVFFLCYFPFLCVVWVESPVLKQLTLTVLSMNSSINPVIYFWRIRNMRNAAIKMLPQCLQRERNQGHEQQAREQGIQQTQPVQLMIHNTTVVPIQQIQPVQQMQQLELQTQHEKQNKVQ